MDEHRKLLVESWTVKPGKDARKLHRELRKYKDGLPIWLRYPGIPYWIAATTTVIAAAKVILDAMH